MDISKICAKLEGTGLVILLDGDFREHMLRYNIYSPLHTDDEGNDIYRFFGFVNIYPREAILEPSGKWSWYHPAGRREDDRDDVDLTATSKKELVSWKKLAKKMEVTERNPSIPMEILEKIYRDWFAGKL